MDDVALLLSLSGEDTMGEFDNAHDTRMVRDVRVKVLPTEPGDRERVRREAHTAGPLTEPHNGVDFGRDGFDDGRTVAGVWSRKPLCTTIVAAWPPPSSPGGLGGLP